MSKQFYLVMPYIVRGEYYWSKRLEGWSFSLPISLAYWPPTFRYFTIITHGFVDLNTQNDQRPFLDVVSFLVSTCVPSVVPFSEASSSYVYILLCNGIALSSKLVHLGHGIGTLALISLFGCFTSVPFLWFLQFSHICSKDVHLYRWYFLLWL